MTIPPLESGAGQGWRELLAVAISAAQLGGRVLRRSFRRLRPGEVSEKARNDFVSVADQASEAAIVSFLQAHTPELGMLAEEQGLREMPPSGGSSTPWTAPSTS